MPYEWFLIIVPGVFVLGWLSARLDIRHIRRSAAELPRAYLRGLTELLNGNDNKALDAFSDIEQKENLPPALQFTVGELSRRRGDYRRALKVHQELQENEKLGEADRHRALWELANDCAAMGFVDAAEQHARLLADIPDYRHRVFDFLLKNYQTRRLYTRALELISGADDDVRQLQQTTAAHLYCQLATDADGARQADLLNQALAINPACARARLQLAERALAATPPRPADALACYQNIAAESPHYLWLAVAGLWRAYAASGETARAQQQLSRWLREFSSPMLFKTIVALLEAQLPAASDQERATIEQMIRSLIEEFVLSHGGMEAAAYFIDRQARNGHTAQWLAVKKTLLQACRKAFVCRDCGYEISTFDWQCPCCLHWESFEQRRQ